MRYPVYWTPRAKNNLDSIKHYLSEEWNKAISLGFENKVKDFADIIKEFPNLGSEKSLLALEGLSQIVLDRLLKNI